MKKTGGRLFGEGVYGATYDFACKLDDNETFCNILTHKKIKSIDLHSFSKVLLLEKHEEIKAFIKFIHDLDRYVAKIFKSYMIGIDKRSFIEEIKNMETVYKIFGDQTEKQTTLTKLNYLNFNMIGAHIIFEDETSTFSTFTSKCNSDLQHTKINPNRLNKLIVNGLETLESMQKKDFVHCDIKPDNIIYCKKENKFKLIDWGISNFIKPNVRLSGNTPCGFPISFYIGGMPAIIAIRLIYYSNWKRFPEFFKSAIFQDLYKMIQKEFNEAIKLSKKTLLTKYGKKIDVFAFGMTLAYLIHKNNLDWDKHREFVTSLISLKGIPDAHNALKEFKIER